MKAVGQKDMAAGHRGHDCELRCIPLRTHENGCWLLEKSVMDCELGNIPLADAA